MSKPPEGTTRISSPPWIKAEYEEKQKRDIKESLRLKKLKKRKVKAKPPIIRRRGAC